MRRIRHLSPRYVLDRLVELFYQKTHPTDPWLTKQANAILAGILKDSDIGLEFGSGRSTIWLAQRIRHLTSIEHDARWFEKVRHDLELLGIQNVDHRLLPRLADDEDPSNSQYVRFIDTLTRHSVDFALVDGIYREHCAIRVLDKIRPGGFLILDNANRYLPSDTRTPRSRSLVSGPLNLVWGQVAKELAGWRSVWTSSGVIDTAIYFKPCGS